jgi:hypothetical protein
LKKAEHLKIKDVHDDEVVLVTIVRRDGKRRNVCQSADLIDFHLNGIGHETPSGSKHTHDSVYDKVITHPTNVPKDPLFPSFSQ